ncbi:MAG TPA: helix-turn-helix domain-containing protein [Candidatus Binatia bacterium]|nr:helix-turn-helix domain-containing protein [Candidatus Binatia bacterium]
MNAEEVKAVRGKLGLTQVEFASQVGVQRNTVWRWEAGTLTIGTTAAILIRLLAKQAAKKRRRRE